jgi:molybdate transport system substrate-binding protein
MRIKQALVAAAAFAMVASAAAHAETVEIYSAGSLRGVVGDLAKEAGPALDVELKPSFGGAGAMRQRIEGGEKPDLFLSADMGSPRKLEAEGRTAVPVVAFARNRMCVVSRRSMGVTAANLVDRMLAKGVRVKTSTPGADPAGDYAWAIFDRVDAMRPGSGEVLRQKAQSVMNATVPAASPGQSPTAALFASRQIDLSITYCSAAGALEKERPELASLPVPPELDPHPVFGLAVLSTNPNALRLALFLLSEKGQAVVAKNGLLPLLDAPR